MALDVRLLDTRIAARFREPKPTDIIVGSTRKMDWIIGEVGRVLGEHKLRVLSICCHGYETVVADPQAMISRVGGGLGLEFGADGVNFSTVSAFSSLAGKFTPDGRIDIYSCAAADDSSDKTNGGFTGNGRALMRELAGHAGVLVRASDATQTYTAGVVSSFFGLVTSYQGADFGEWEGNVWMFQPDGSIRKDTAPGRGTF